LPERARCFVAGASAAKVGRAVTGQGCWTFVATFSLLGDQSRRLRSELGNQRGQTAGLLERHEMTHVSHDAVACPRNVAREAAMHIRLEHRIFSRGNPKRRDREGRNSRRQVLFFTCHAAVEQVEADVGVGRVRVEQVERDVTLVLANCSSGEGSVT